MGEIRKTEIPAGSTCLMITLNDERHLMTEIKNFDLLIEFARHSNSELSIVELTENGEAFVFEELADMINNDDDIKIPSHRVIEIKINSVKKNKDISDNVYKMINEWLGD